MLRVNQPRVACLASILAFIPWWLACPILYPAIAPNAEETEFAELRDAFVAQLRPAYIEYATALWEADITGEDDAYDRLAAADKAYDALYADPAVFAALERLKTGGAIRGAVPRRELEVMYRDFLVSQGDPELLEQIADLEADTDRIVNAYRGLVDAVPLSGNDISAILSETRDSAEAETAWKAYMNLGVEVESNLRRLVALRNQTAREQGFSDYYSQQLASQEIDEDELFVLFDDLNERTREPYAALKAQIDAERAARFGISVAELRPWHYGQIFFQEALGDQATLLNDLYADTDPVELARAYYASMGFDVDDVLARSDLYEKPGKLSTGAYSMDIDRADDIRLLCNVRPSLLWVDTMLHELGHAAYAINIDADVPFLLHTESHILVTEGVALLMGSMARNEEWLSHALSLSADQAAVAAAAREIDREQLLIFSRWAQVMTRFERSLYADPEQDLNALWWNLEEEYQLLTPPDDSAGFDYAVKSHILLSPAYYHNYMLGYLFAFQLQDAVAARVLGIDDSAEAAGASFYGSTAAGDYLRVNVFAPGNLRSWKEHVRRATGAPLSAEAFGRRIAGEE